MSATRRTERTIETTVDHGADDGGEDALRGRGIVDDQDRNARGPLVEDRDPLLGEGHRRSERAEEEGHRHRADEKAAAQRVLGVAEESLDDGEHASEAIMKGSRWAPPRNRRGEALEVVRVEVGWSRSGSTARAFPQGGPPERPTSRMIDQNHDRAPREPVLCAGERRLGARRRGIAPARKRRARVEGDEPSVHGHRDRERRR